MAKLSKKFTSQGMDNHSYNELFGIYENLIYGWSGSVPVAIKVNPNGTIDGDEYAVNDYEDASATVTYVGKEDRDGVYLIIKIDSTSGYAVSYATITNNASVTSYSDAWTNRATLTYGDFSGAF